MVNAQAEGQSHHIRVYSIQIVIYSQKNLITLSTKRTTGQTQVINDQKRISKLEKKSKQHMLAELATMLYAPKSPNRFELNATGRATPYY